MKLHSSLPLALAAGALATVALGAAPVPSDQNFTFEVTVTNLTRNQPISPVLLASHDESVALFELGMPASDELALLAEDGDSSELTALLMADSGVYSVVSGAAPIGPGGSETLLITTKGPKRRLSLAGMLVNTNDAFVALDAHELPRHGTQRLLVPALDAGSETNNELCAYIPGPACGSPFVRDTTGAEGYVHVHAGIHGVGDLAPEAYDWKNPAALVTVRRVR